MNKIKFWGIQKFKNFMSNYMNKALYELKFGVAACREKFE